MTGTAHRFSFEKSPQHEWQRAQRSAMPLCVLLMQIDGFSDYLTQIGEATAKGLLCEIAEALRSVVQRPTDLLARYGIETFAALLPDTDASGSTTVARRAVRAINALPALKGAAQADLALYLGIASSRAAPHSPKNVIGSRDKSSAAISEPKQMLVDAAEESIRAARTGKKQMALGGVTVDTADPETIA